MIKNLRRKEDHFSKVKYLSEIQSQKELLQKELDLNMEEQNLLGKKISTLKEHKKKIGLEDPKVALINHDIKMDEIYLSELRKEEGIIKEYLA